MVDVHFRAASLYSGLDSSYVGFDFPEDCGGTGLATAEGSGMGLRSGEEAAGLDAEEAGCCCNGTKRVEEAVFDGGVVFVEATATGAFAGEAGAAGAVFVLG